MNINVLEKDLSKIAIIDTYTSLMWCKRYNETGALDLQIEATDKSLELFTEGRYITRDDDDTVYVIRSIEVDTQENHDNHLIVGGVDIKSILGQRVIWNPVSFYGTVENYIRKLVTDNIISPTIANRRIDNFILAEPIGITNIIRQQVSYEPLDEKVIELCKTYNLGWKVTLDDDNNFVFSLTQGVDRSTSQDVLSPIIFSPSFDNLSSSKYKSDSTKYKNVALIGGEGEGAARKMASIGDCAGINRFEMFVDNGTSSTAIGETISKSEYIEQLQSKGQDELSKNVATTDFEGEVVADSYKYKSDYDLGDVVTVTNEFGITADARIVEIVETWDDEGYTLEPVFEFNIDIE